MDDPVLFWAKTIPVTCTLTLMVRCNINVSGFATTEWVVYLWIYDMASSERNFFFIIKSISTKLSTQTVLQKSNVKPLK